MKALSMQKFDADFEGDLEFIYKKLVKDTKKYFKCSGFEKAVLGLSGGLDSTICAVILADALGNENVVGISMPSKITSVDSKNDARELAKNLGIIFLEIPIGDMVSTTKETLDCGFMEIEKSWDCRFKQSYTIDNIQARSRAVIVWGVSNEFGKCLPIATSDKSESYMGYATINGDMSGGFAPIVDVCKTKLFSLARWLNKNRKVKNAIPESIILKRPGAELAIDPKTNKPLLAEDALMPYEFLDEVIWRVESKNENYNDMINSKFSYEVKNNISKKQKEEWLQKFYRRAKGATFKWSIMPSGVVIDKKGYEKKNIKKQLKSLV